ncbi:MAG: cytochrome c oxidase accessory protein CcoG [Bacteroidota bacterium]|nr:cytochrome c oxidase accessory protein CcoG [Bacteroidota bacterium]
MSKPIEHLNEIHTEEFRDRIATVDESGHRKWIYAHKPKGKLYKIRSWLSYLYFLIFFGLPFVQINGRPLFQFNIPEAKFIIFGKVFWPQDFFIFGLTMITFIFFIILFTAAFGRLFCGWACPQTNFMEMMFRKVEYLVLGDAGAQKQLKKAPWTTGKIVKIATKHILFYLLSFIIANFFLAYIIGMKQLEKIITEPVSEHIVGFASLLVFSGVFYAVYAFFREQACTVVCPYGRLQSVLLDKNSMIVAYDYKRGEPRGNFKKQAEQKLGDCVDCFQCVRVCPTGIDIRNGVQMECVGCTACIDACNDVMDKVGKPRGLIRYASENSIAEGIPLRYTARMKMYTALCSLVLVVLSFILMSRKDVDATIMRTPGILYQERGADSVSNLYNIKVVNKTTKDVPLSIKLEDGKGVVSIIGKPYINVQKEGQGAGSFFVILPKRMIRDRKTKLILGLYENDKRIAIMSTNFLGPVSE